MPDESKPPVTLRIRVGSSEFEVTGPKDYAEAKILEFMKILGEAATKADTPKREGQEETSISTPDQKGKTVSISQFFKKANPRSDVDRVLVAGFFLENQRKMPSFTAGELRALISEAKYPPPRNVNDAVNQNIKKALMMPSGDKEGRMAFVLTSDGESTVEGMTNQAG